MVFDPDSIRLGLSEPIEFIRSRLDLDNLYFYDVLKKESNQIHTSFMVQEATFQSDVPEMLAQYKSDMQGIEQRHMAGEDPRVVVREISDATDTLVLRVLLLHLNTILKTDELPKHMLLLAQGGYGRRHQHPKSDIDLLFLYKSVLNKQEEEIVKSTFRTLFDMGFTVGHSFRHYKDAIDTAYTDAHSQTAMSESRFLAGDWRLFEQFKHDLWRMLYRTRKERIRTKTNEREERLARQGVTINISEPNVKESTGGLRDFHFGLWLGSLQMGRTMNLLYLKRSHLIDDQAMARIEQAVTFLWRLRNDLHFLTGKEQDVLALPIQQEISKRLGYKDKIDRLAEESMMRDYYGHALTICQFAEHMKGICLPKPFWKKMRFFPRKLLGDGFCVCNDEILIPQDIHFYEHNPQRMLYTFINAAQEKARLGHDTAVAIQDNLDLIDQAFLHDKHNAELLQDFFNLDCKIEPAIQEMRRTGLLTRLIPEWRGIDNLIRYDLVHRYTVDEHSLLCLYHLENLLEDKTKYSEERFILWRECNHRDVLRLAVMLHDIGKGRQGDHSIIGSRLANEIAARLRLTEIKRKKLVFLIRYHLMMSHTAQHMDTSDPQVTADFVDAFEDLEDLNMLYLLTYVDMRSVSPESMTEWKNNLLRQLYLASRAIIMGETPSLDKHDKHVITRKEQLTQSLDPKFDRSLIDRHLSLLPISYMLNQSLRSIEQHLRSIQEFDGTLPVTKFIPHVDPRCREMILVYKDRVGLFNRICTAVLLENFSIMEARLNTRADGLVCNNIVIRDALSQDPISESRQFLLQERINRIVPSNEPIPAIPKPPGMKSLGRMSFESSVKISNDSSARYTVLVIRCADRKGLLQDITSVLSTMTINIYFARIITEGSRVTDVFYIADSTGEKIVDDALLEKLKQALLERLDVSIHYESVK